MSEEPFNHSQYFQQAIATTITCRSIVKYNSTLSAEQREEILTEIESTLAFLEARLEANASIEASQNLSPSRLVDLLASETFTEEEPLQPSEQEPSELSLQSLYKLYHAYLSGERIAALETRYKTVMEVLDQLQLQTEQRHDITAGDLTIEQLMHRVRGFITAVYCMFREFAVLFSNIVEGKSIDMDTEGLALLEKYSLEETSRQVTRDISPLLGVYSAHLQLQERTGVLTTCAREATAFLVFLEGCLGQSFVRRQEAIVQLQIIAGLLDDLTRLLNEYEQAMSHVIAT